MELHRGHEGLHRPRPHTRSGPNDWRGSQPEDLGGADDHWAGCKRDRRGNGFMLGNQSRFSQQPAKIWPDQERVRRFYKELMFLAT